MPNAAVSVVVPASGLGPSANVSALIGEKTVVLGGAYSGTYVLLGSQDGGATFVPVATFDADGSDAIEQTVPAAFQLVRLRTLAGTVQATPVTCSVSGLSSPGANQFATLASFLPGSSGASVVVDTYTVFPGTGLEDDVAILCSGGFIGTVSVEASPDLVNWNAVGTFQAGPSPRPLLGLPVPLEFAPLVTRDKVRYLRVVVQGQVLSAVVVTIGGSVGVAAPPSSTTLSEAYDNGLVPGDQELTLLDAFGGGVVVDGTQAGFTGANSFEVVSVAGSVAFPRLGGLNVDGNAVFNDSVAVGVAAPTARLELAAGTAVAGTASLKVGAGVLLTVEEPGAVESDGTHLYWTDAGGNRLQLDGGGTLANAYSAGTVAGDQTLALEDADGGGIVVDGTSATFTGVSSLSVVSAAGSVSFLRTGGLAADGNAVFNDSVAVGVAAPTARLELAAGTAVAGTASLKIGAGALLAVEEPGAVESDGTHLYWTNAGGNRLQLDGGGTLANAYSAGTVVGDQTLALEDADGGGVVVDGTSATFTGPTALQVVVSGGVVNLYKKGGLDVSSSFSIVAAAGSNWNEVDLLSSTVTLTGGPAVVTRLSMVRVGSGVVNGAGNTVSDAYDLYVGAAPTGTATLSRSWSLGVEGNSRFIGDVGVNTTIAPSTRLEVVQGASTSTAGNATNAGTIKVTNNSINGPEALGGIEIQSEVNYLGSGQGAGVKLYANASSRTAGLAVRRGLATWTIGLVMSQGTGNVNIGSSGVPADTTALRVSASKDVTSAAGANWNGFHVNASTLTVTGATNITALNLAYVGDAMVQAASALVVGDFYNLRIGTATFAGAGPATASRNWSLGVDGNTKLGGGITIFAKQILVGASPYAVLQTDFGLEVQSNGGAITVTLPALTGGTVPNGRLIMIDDSGYNAAVSNITFALGNAADKINNVNAAYVQNVSGACLWLKANTTTLNWEFV